MEVEATAHFAIPLGEENQLCLSKSKSKALKKKKKNRTRKKLLKIKLQDTCEDSQFPIHNLVRKS